MTKAQKKETKKLIASLYKQIESLENLLLDDVKEETVVNTNLENRNYDVFICRQYLYMNYEQIANALGITVAQVGESLKVLRDKGLIASSRKSPTIIEDYMDDVKKLKKKHYSKAAIAKELSISPQTVTRCLERLK